MSVSVWLVGLQSFAQAGGGRQIRGGKNKNKRKGVGKHPNASSWRRSIALHPVHLLMRSADRCMHIARKFDVERARHQSKQSCWNLDRRMVGNCVVALSTVPTTVLLTTFIWSRFSCLKSDMDFDFFIALIVIMGAENQKMYDKRALRGDVNKSLAGRYRRAHCLGKQGGRDMTAGPCLKTRYAPDVALASNTMRHGIASNSCMHPTLPSRPGWPPWSLFRHFPAK